MIDEPSRTPDALRAERVLRYAAFLFAAGLAAHTADHLPRGLDILTTEVVWVGNVSMVMAVVAITLALTRYRLAPLVAIVAGFAQALGVAAVHLLLHRSAFSDSLPDGNVDALSWAAVLAEILGALAFGAAGVYALRHDRWRPLALAAPKESARVTERHRESASWTPPSVDHSAGRLSCAAARPARGRTKRRSRDRRF